MGGRASIVGTLLGALLLGAIRTGLTLHNVNPYVSYVVTGLIILVAVLMDRFISRKQERMNTTTQPQSWPPASTASPSAEGWLTQGEDGHHSSSSRARARPPVSTRSRSTTPSTSLTSPGRDPRGRQERRPRRHRDPGPLALLAFSDGAFTAESARGARRCSAAGQGRRWTWPARSAPTTSCSGRRTTATSTPSSSTTARAWEHAVECYGEVADYAGDIDVSIEYKPAEPRARTLLSTTGSVLALIAETGRDEPAVDTRLRAHADGRREPGPVDRAAASRRAASSGLQLNDGWGAKADDGLAVGSVHLVQTLEALFYLSATGTRAPTTSTPTPSARTPGRVRAEHRAHQAAARDRPASSSPPGRCPTVDAVARPATAWWEPW